MRLILKSGAFVVLAIKQNLILKFDIANKTNFCTSDPEILQRQFLESSHQDTTNEPKLIV